MKKLVLLTLLTLLISAHKVKAWCDLRHIAMEQPLEVGPEELNIEV